MKFRNASRNQSKNQFKIINSSDENAEFGMKYFYTQLLSPYSPISMKVAVSVHYSLYCLFFYILIRGSQDFFEMVRTIPLSAKKREESRVWTGWVGSFIYFLLYGILYWISVCTLSVCKSFSVVNIVVKRSIWKVK